MEQKYKYYRNDLESFDIFHEEEGERTYIGNTDNAEKADFITKAINIFSALCNSGGSGKGKGISGLNDINIKSNEGVLLFTALIHLSSFPPFSHLNPEEVLNKLAVNAGEWFDNWQQYDIYEGRKAVLIPVTNGNDAGQWRFVLKAANSEILGLGEHYTRKEAAVKTLEKHFSNFEIVDISVENR